MLVSVGNKRQIPKPRQQKLTPSFLRGRVSFGFVFTGCSNFFLKQIAISD